MRNKIDILYLNASGCVWEKEVVGEREYYGSTISTTSIWCGKSSTQLFCIGSGDKVEIATTIAGYSLEREKTNNIV